MKGISCGKRVIGLVALTTLACALAPGFARADVTAGAVPSVNVAPPAAPVVSTPALPAAPAAPAVPAAPAAPAASVPTAKANPIAGAKIVGGTLSADPATGTFTIHTKVAEASTKDVSPSSGSVNVSASKVVKPVNTALQNVGSKAYKKATSVKAVHKAVTKASRVSAWANDDPMSGCTNNAWMTCTVLAPFPIENRCYGNQTGSYSGNTADAPTSGDTVSWTQGTTVIWTKTEMVTLHGMPAVRMHMKQFTWGWNGFGDLDASTYKLGHDFQDEKVVTLPVGGPSVNALTQDVLLVNNGLAPNEVFTQHIVMDANGNISFFWHIVCRKGDRGDHHGDDGGDHDRSGDYDKYKHNHGDYHGYNDDQPSSWDQDD